MRLAICKKDSNIAIGLIDLFDFDPKNKRAGIGIVIQNEVNRSIGYGNEALQLLIDYSFIHLQLHQLFANIGVNNLLGIKFFTKFGFECIGTKKDWNLIQNHYQDELFYQLINKNNWFWIQILKEYLV